MNEGAALGDLTGNITMLAATSIALLLLGSAAFRWD